MRMETSRRFASFQIRKNDPYPGTHSPAEHRTPRCGALFPFRRANGSTRTAVDACRRKVANSRANTAPGAGAGAGPEDGGLPPTDTDVRRVGSITGVDATVYGACQFGVELVSRVRAERAALRCAACVRGQCSAGHGPRQAGTGHAARQWLTVRWSGRGTAVASCSGSQPHALFLLFRSFFSFHWPGQAARSWR